MWCNADINTTAFSCDLMMHFPTVADPPQQQCNNTSTPTLLSGQILPEFLKAANTSTNLGRQRHDDCWFYLNGEAISALQQCQQADSRASHFLAK